jgi:hypothetical protein
MNLGDNPRSMQWLVTLLVSRKGDTYPTSESFSEDHLSITLVIMHRKKFSLRAKTCPMTSEPCFYFAVEVNLIELKH